MTISARVRIATAGLIALLMLHPPIASSADSAPAYATDDPLLKLNRDFTNAYGRLITQDIPGLSPVILECGETMTLLKNGAQSSAPAFGRRYRELEAVSHVPVTVYVLLMRETGKPLTQPTLDGLRTYRASVVSARAALPSGDFTSDERTRQERIIDDALKFIDDTVAARRVSSDELHAYARGQTTNVTANVRDAAQDQIDTMDRAVTKWTAAMTAQERAHLKVAVCGPHMPRIGNISLQYFAASLGYPYAGRYQEEPSIGENLDLIFAEGVYDHDKILRLLATHAIDANLGEAFFNEPARMHRDLLADTAEEILKSRFPNARPANHP